MTTYKINSVDELRKKISFQMRKNRDSGIREKVALFYLALKLSNVSEACARRGVTRDYFHRWWKRFCGSGYRLEALRHRSRRPKHSPRKISEALEARIRFLRRTRGLGAEMISYYLKREGRVVSISTISHILSRRRSRLKVRRVKLKAHRKRYELPIPGQRLQMDVKHAGRLLDGRKIYVYVAIDECTRWRYAKAFLNYNGLNTVSFLDEVALRMPFPIQVIQTDNGVEFTYTLHPPKDFKTNHHAMALWCKEKKIFHRRIPPGEKELNGKVERSHRIDDDYFYHKAPRDSLERFNSALARWITLYNTDRPHGGLKGLTPFEKLEERVLKLPLEEVEQRWLPAKKRFLNDFPRHHNPEQQLIYELKKELLLYNDSIRGL